MLAAAPARALIDPPVTLEGASAGVVELGGAAIAPDGSGGLVYTKLIDGVPHVFAIPYAQGVWGSPVRVDGDQPFDASAPRIAAGDGGELLVVWVTQMATVHDKIQRGLVAATLAPGADSFSPSVIVDPNVGDGANVSPSLAATASGQAYVAYRVVTNDFTDPSTIGTAVQLRPGDVLEDVRVATLSGSRWLRLSAINHDPLVSMRPPTDANAPQIDAGPDGSAVVAWHEPDQSGVDRIWQRRITGTSVGPASEGSPGGGPPGGNAVAAPNSSGGGVTAWQAADANGNAGVGVREDFPSGAAQTAIISSADGGPVSHLLIGSADSGDAIVAFEQGEPGRLEIVADRVTVPPAGFAVRTPDRWVRPSAASINWEPAPSAVGGVTYTVLLDGRAIASGLTSRSLLPSPGLLGDGTRSVQVLATDALGQQLLAPAVGLRVDARPPRVTVAGVGRRRLVVRVSDSESGVARGATRCSFGDRSRVVRGTESCSHRYRRPGRYTIVVRARDVVGNQTTRTILVEVR